MRPAPADLWNVLDAAYAAGVRYVDVARSYGRAEEFLAGWLAARPGRVGRARWGPSGATGMSGTGASRRTSTRSRTTRSGRSPSRSTRSLALLGGHLERATTSTRRRRRPACSTTGPLLAALARLRERGVPGGAVHLRTGPGVRPCGRPSASRSFLSGTTAVHLGPVDVERPGDLGRAPRWPRRPPAGADVIVKEPVANGRLAPGGAAPERQGRRPGRGTGRGPRGCRSTQLAIAAALARPWAWCVLSGGVDPAQVASKTTPPRPPVDRPRRRPGRARRPSPRNRTPTGKPAPGGPGADQPPGRRP